MNHAAPTRGIIAALTAAVWINLPAGAAAVAAPAEAPAPAVPASESSAAQGKAVFFGNWVAEGQAGDQVGLGPLFNAPSCNTCHEQGGRARGPASDGIAPPGLVIHLAVQEGVGQRGDPVYGQVLNTSAVGGARAEGVVRISYTEKAGYYYPFGSRWVIRVPHYHVTDLAFGPLDPSTVIKPRIAPALFGVSVLESLPGATRRSGANPVAASAAASPEPGFGASGRLGWQLDAASIREQTAIALATDIGVTSPVRVADDCTPREEPFCRTPSRSPETTAGVLDALVEFQRGLAPPSPQRQDIDSDGSRLFTLIGCPACHSDRSVESPSQGVIHRVIPYTDMRAHNLGPSMADETVAGVKVVTEWRTAPLWGIAQRLRDSSNATFLHDGRARSAEEAVLWHGGEAAKVTRRFMQLGTQERATLLAWLESR